MREIHKCPDVVRAKEPWKWPEMAGNVVASALGVKAYPGLCFELGDTVGEQYIPHAVVDSALRHPRLTVALWQPSQVTFVNIRHTPERSMALGLMHSDRPSTDMCSIERFDQYPRQQEPCPPGVRFVLLQENLDPRPVCQALNRILRVPLGRELPQQDVFDWHEPVGRILIEFPDYTEDRPGLPVDTSLGTLALLASQEFIDITAPIKV